MEAPGVKVLVAGVDNQVIGVVALVMAVVMVAVQAGEVAMDISKSPNFLHLKWSVTWSQFCTLQFCSYQRLNVHLSCGCFFFLIFIFFLFFFLAGR